MKRRLFNHRCPGTAGAVLLFLGLAGPCLGASLKFNNLKAEAGSGVTIEATVPFDELPSSGFVPVEIVQGNRTGKLLDYLFLFQAGNTFGRSGQTTFSDSARVDPGQGRRSLVFLPLSSLESESQINLTVSGYGLENESGYLYASSGSEGRPLIGASVVLGGGLIGEVREAFKKEASSGGLAKIPVKGAFARNRNDNLHAGGGSSPEMRDSELNFARLPADWRTFSGFSALLIGSEEWGGLGAPMKNALNDWVLQGGRLVILPSTAGAGALSGDPSGQHGLGLIRRAEMKGSAVDVEKLAHELLLLYYNPALAHNNDYTKGWALDDQVEGIVVNSWMIIGIVVAFALVIGPVNLFLLAPASRRYRLFITVPVISVGAALVLVTVIVLIDGFGGRGARLTAVILDPERPRAMIWQEQVARTSVLLTRRFPLKDDVMMVSLLEKNRYRDEGIYGRDSNSAWGDFFMSKARLRHHLRTVTSTRGRVEVVSRSQDSMEVISSLPDMLDLLMVKDDVGKWWSARDVAQGRRAVLHPMPDEAADKMKGLILDDASLPLKESLRDASAPGGSFLARASKDVGHLPIPTLPSIDWKMDEIVYAGRVGAGRPEKGNP